MSKCEVCQKELDAAGFCSDCDYLCDLKTDQFVPPKDGKISKERLAKQAELKRSRPAASGHADWILPFGTKHKGDPLKSIPVRYLDWLIGEPWLRADTRDKIRLHLEIDRAKEWNALED